MRLPRLAAAASVAALAIAGLAGCADQAAPSASQAAVLGDASKADLTLTAADGTETTLEAMPQRVVVLEYAALDTIHALGLDGVVVATPKATLPEPLAAFSADTVADAGTLKEPDFEAIAAADPDLILIGGRSADVAGQLAEIAPVANVATGTGPFVEAAIERAEDVAGLFGMQDEAADEIEAIRGKAEELTGLANGQRAMFLMSSGGKLSAYGPGSRYGFLFDELGFVSAAEVDASSGHGQEVSFEFVSQANPEVIFAIDRDSAIGQSGEAAAAVLDNELINATDAAKQGRIVMLDGQSWYLVTGGLTTTAAMLDEVQAALAK